MKCWTILALLVAVCAVFLGVGHTEETEDDFIEPALKDALQDEELSDSFKNTENDDDDDDDEKSDSISLVEMENALDSVNETPSNDEDEPVMFKRAPWGRRRRRRGWFRRIRIRFRKVCKWFRYVPKYGHICAAYRFIGDEESSRLKNDKQAAQNDKP